MTVSYDNSKAEYEGIKEAGMRSLSALPETWLGLLLQRAEDDPEMSRIQVAGEEEAIGCTVTDTTACSLPTLEPDRPSSPSCSLVGTDAKRWSRGPAAALPSRSPLILASSAS